MRDPLVASECILPPCGAVAASGGVRDAGGKAPAPQSVNGGAQPARLPSAPCGVWFIRSTRTLSDPHSTDPDELLRLAQSGDQQAAGLLLERYRNYLSLLARLQINRRLQGKID